MHRALVAVLTALVVVLAFPAAPVSAASSVKVVIIAGPVGSSTAHYTADAEAIATEARRYTSNVVKLVTPTATWARVKAAAQDASILVYLGHGNGWPSIYAPFQVLTKDGLGLDPASGADGTKTVYYGEDYIRGNIRLAPNAVVLLYHLCYASGNSQPGLAAGTFADARLRVDNYGAGFIGAGARAVFAEGHPSHPATDYIHQLFTTNRTMDQVFRSAPSRHGHVLGPYVSQRTPGLRFELDPDLATPSGFYRSVVGDLALTASAVTGLGPEPTGDTPPDFIVPGAAEVAGAAGSGLFATAEQAADPVLEAPTILPAGTRLRITAEGTAMADGTRVFAVTVLGAATSGFVRATELAPRDSAATAIWTLDHSADLLSPNADGVNDELVVSARASETVTASFVVRNAAGVALRSATLAGDIIRATWDLRTSAGAIVPDGDYTWSLRVRDGWGNASASHTGTFTVDGTPPVSSATATSTAGRAGWSVSPATVTITALDSLSGVGSINWRLDGGTTRTYTAPVVVGANGASVLEYRATDRAGIKEPWKTLNLRIDTVPPAIDIRLTGTAGDTAGTWRGPVSVAPSITDGTSGAGTSTISVDGSPAVTLGGAPTMVPADGVHTISVTALDAAGNSSTATASFLVDTVAPVLVLPATETPGVAIPTVTPNGDGLTETALIPYAASEPGTVRAVVTDGTGAVVRTVASVAALGANSAAWDGRTTTGADAPDGRYTLSLTATDPAGNTSTPVSTAVDVYAALASVSRTPALFFPQDGDRLASRSSVGFILLSPATVSVNVVNAAGTVVRTAMADRALPAGAASWAWDGRTDSGAWAPRGGYRFVVRATNGTQAASVTAAVIADAFRVTTSTASPVRGKTFTVTVVTAERLATTPTVTVRQPGVAAWSVVMTKVSSTTWRATIRTKAAGMPGIMSLTVRARDSAGGANSSVVRATAR